MSERERDFVLYWELVKSKIYRADQEAGDPGKS